jgi:8-oxo-dGTP pyrophosphatase MutT (NUDIX family)
MRNERSAGVVVFRDDPAAPGGRKYLVLNYGRFWDYPKGHVEAAEDDRAAALRELAEETGVRDAGIVPGFEKVITYFFRAGPSLIRKQVIFFIARTARKRVRISHEHVGSAWLTYDEALERITYKSSKEVLRAAHEVLNSLTPSPSGKGSR